MLIIRTISAAHGRGAVRMGPFALGALRRRRAHAGHRPCARISRRRDVRGAHLPLPPLMSTEQSTWHGVADGRSSILFAVLAGVSIALVSGGASPIPRRQAATARIRMLARAGCIWLLGIALALTPVPVYVILPAYALLFLLAIPALRWAGHRRFRTAATIALIGPFIVHAANASAWWETESGGYAATALGWHYPVPLWAAFIAAGMGIGRLRLDDWRVLIALLCSGTALAVIGYAVIAPGLALPSMGSGAHRCASLERIG